MAPVAVSTAVWPAFAGRLGPWRDGAGNLWIIALNGSNQATAYKSTNAGTSWTAISSYTTTALSGGSLDADPDSPTAATVIWVLGQTATHTLVVLSFTIGTTAWARFDSGTAPTVNADVNAQFPAFLLKQASGSVAVAYQGPLATYRRVYAAVTSTAGAWGSGTGYMAAVEIDQGGNYSYSLKSACRGASDRLHILYAYARSSHGLSHRSLSGVTLDTAAEPYAATLVETTRQSIAYVNNRLEISGPTSGVTYRAPIHSGQDSQANNTWATDTNAVGNEVNASCASVFAYDSGLGLCAYFRDNATSDVFTNGIATFPTSTTWTTANAVVQSVATAVAAISTSGVRVTPATGGTGIAIAFAEATGLTVFYDFDQTVAPINIVLQTPAGACTVSSGVVVTAPDLITTQSSVGASTVSLDLTAPSTTPTATPVARISLASSGTPETRTNHVLHVRARVQTGVAATVRMALYEGATNRSGDLESSPLTTSLAEYTLAIPDASAANITDYSNLEVRIWGYSATAATPVLEVADLWLETPQAGAAAINVPLQASAGQSTVSGTLTYYLGAFASTGQSTVTGVVTAPALIATQASAGQSGVLATLSRPEPLAPQAPAGQSTVLGSLKQYLGAFGSNGQGGATNTLSRPEPVALQAPAGQSTVSATLKYYLGAFTAQGQSVASGQPQVPGPAFITALSAVGQSGVSAALAYYLGAFAATGQSGVAGVVSARVPIPLQASTGTSTVTGNLKQYLGSFIAAGQSAVAGQPTVPGPSPLPLATSAGQSTVTGNLKQYLGAFSAQGQSGVAATVSAKAPVPLQASAGQSTVSLVLSSGATTTPVARISLASVAAPWARSSHALHIRARVQTNVAATVRMALYEGATNQSGNLESAALTTSLTEYTLAIPDVSAANITDYSNLEVRLWGYSASGAKPVLEVADVWLVIPGAVPVRPANLSPDVAAGQSDASATVIGGVLVTQTPVARISLAAAGTPWQQNSHVLNVRARIRTSGSVTMRMALYEGATNRSGNLESTALTTSLANYTLPIPDANAANIASYQNLEVRLWGYSATGSTPVLEIADVWLVIPGASPIRPAELSLTADCQSSASANLTPYLGVLAAAGQSTAAAQPMFPGALFIASGHATATGSDLGVDESVAFDSGIAVAAGGTATATSYSAEISLVQAATPATASTSGSTITTSFAADVPVGDHIVLIAGFAGAAGFTVSQVSDQAGNTYQVDQLTGTGQSVGAYSTIISGRVTNPLTAGQTITVTLSATPSYRILLAHHYHGLSSTGWVDAHDGQTGTSTTPTSPAVTTTATDLLIGACCYNSGNANTHTSSSPWIEVDEANAATKGLAVSQQLSVHTGTYSDAGSLTTSLLWTDSIVAYVGSAVPVVPCDLGTIRSSCQSGADATVMGQSAHVTLPAASLTRTRAQGYPDIGVPLPAGYARGRGIGVPTTSMTTLPGGSQTAPAGLDHTLPTGIGSAISGRALGTPAAYSVASYGQRHRTLGDPFTTLIPSYARHRALGAPSMPIGTVGRALVHARGLGLLGVYAAYKRPSPAALVHARGIGAAPQFLRLSPPGQAHATRSLGSPRVQSPPKPLGIVHTRRQGTHTVYPAGALWPVRRLGDPRVSEAFNPQPKALVRVRAQGHLTTHGAQLLYTIAIARARKLGNPVTHGRLTPVGLAHDRAYMPAPSVNVRHLTAPPLARA